MTKPLPPDQAQRLRALDPGRSILVQAPAGSGKTDLLTRRFLTLLAQVDNPAQIVAITFSKAAAAEMRIRVLGELEKAAGPTPLLPIDPFSMDSLSRRAIERSNALGWDLVNLPAQLRITTIDSFCYELARQQPLLSGLGGSLNINERPADLYRRASRAALSQVGSTGNLALAQAIESLLLWRDNNWQELEDLLIKMLASRDRWMQGFVLDRDLDEATLRARLERPFSRFIHRELTRLHGLFAQLPGAFEEALALARFAVSHGGGEILQPLAELPSFPAGPFLDAEAKEEARGAWLAVAHLLLTGAGAFRKSIDKNLGFPADRKPEKARLAGLIDSLKAIPHLEDSLAGVRAFPPARYTDEDWEIIRACFTLLHAAAAELRVVFAETSQVDYTEVAQIALRVLQDEDGWPTDAALALADGIRHLLVDEFQDTSRRQHRLLSRLIAAWPEREGRTCFVVGDPMQSIYFFREADAELFPRVRDNGLAVESPGPDPAPPLLFDSAALSANFRSAPALVTRLNGIFDQVFAAEDGSGITFTAAQPAREPVPGAPVPFHLHTCFLPPSPSPDQKEAAREEQIEQIVALIQSYRPSIEAALLTQKLTDKKKFRVAVLGRANKHLIPIAEALRRAGIPFRAVGLENLSDRPEVLDALALARALLNPEDRVAWLGVLRAPWSGLSLADLYALVATPQLPARPVPELLAGSHDGLSPEGRAAATRVLSAYRSALALRADRPTSALGTWLQQVWMLLGGDSCVDATARANLDLLWNCLDQLPSGDEGLLGPELVAALEGLTAQPNPEADSNCGVQLMSIHRSKGLEFEVVIVPELQAGTGKARNAGKLLSWLERGLNPGPDEDPADPADITEFLIAPLPTKGTDPGPAKKWVDRVYSDRETQEMRRVLYVAATRAREQLHLFARPGCKLEKDGTLAVAEPSGSLLATAWPALKAEIHAHLDDQSPDHLGAEIEAIAAQEESNLFVMPAPPGSTLLRRLPPDFQPRSALRLQAAADEAMRGMGTGSGPLFARHQGGLLSRARGTAVHRLLEELARLRATLDWDSARTALQELQPRIAAQVQAAGVDPANAALIAAQALQQVLRASQDPIGAWILSPHPGAASEVSWAGIVDGGLQTVRIDRIFQAGATPGSEGSECWWIIDYKTAHLDNADPVAALPELRSLFAPQIAAYAQILRNLHGPDAPVRAGLYYPRMLQLDWWQI